jgi:hypothetical protein
MFSKHVFIFYRAISFDLTAVKKIKLFIFFEVTEDWKIPVQDISIFHILIITIGKILILVLKYT